MDVNSDTFAAPQFAASGCNFSTCPARGSRNDSEFRSKFLRTAIFNTNSAGSLNLNHPRSPKSPGQFCAHEGNAHGPRHLRDLRAHTRVFPYHLRAHKTTTSCAQPPSSCAQRFVQTSLARYTVRDIVHRSKVERRVPPVLSYACHELCRMVERSGVEGSQVEPSNGPHSAPLIPESHVIAPHFATPIALGRLARTNYNSRSYCTY
jgi:hypothetical protein